MDQHRCGCLQCVESSMNMMSCQKIRFIIEGCQSYSPYHCFLYTNISRAEKAQCDLEMQYPAYYLLAPNPDKVGKDFQLVLKVEQYSMLKTLFPTILLAYQSKKNIFNGNNCFLLRAIPFKVMGRGGGSGKKR